MIRTTAVMPTPAPSSDTRRSVSRPRSRGSRRPSTTGAVDNIRGLALQPERTPMSDQPENTRRPQPDDIEQRSLTQAALHVTEAFAGGAGFGIAKPVGEAIADKIRKPK